MERIYSRGYCERATVAEAKPGTPIRFVASTAGVKRDGLSLDMSGADLANFHANPAFLWSHDYTGQRPPIGRVDHMAVERGSLVADVTFDQGDEFAREVERKYRTGFLNAVSIGFDIHEFAPPADGKPPTATKWEVIELSGVNIPGDPQALMERQRRAYADLGRALLDAAGEPARADVARRVIPPNTGGPKQDMEAAWDGPGEVAAAEASATVLRRMHAWVDEDGDADAKTSYKFPHHTAEGQLNFKGCVAALGRLDQADIPDGDKDGVRRHIVAHYREFDQEPPERGHEPAAARATWEQTAAAMVRLFVPFAQRPEEEREAEYRRLSREYGRHKRTPPEFIAQTALDRMTWDDIRGLYLEGEPDVETAWFTWMEGRAGQVLSSRNRGRIEGAIASLQEVLASAEKPKDNESDDNDGRMTDMVAHLAKTLGVTT